MQKRNPQKFAFIKQCIASGKVYVVNPNTPFVLAGTLGELWCIDANKLASRYTLIRDGQPLRITPQTLGERSHGGLLDWTLVRTVPDKSQAWACFVPLRQKGQIQTSWGAVLNINGVGVSHGKGDFVIAADAGGRPDISHSYVVNGNVFATTYNNQGWSDCLDSRHTSHYGRTSAANVTIADLPRLISDEEKIDSIVATQMGLNN